VEEFWNDLKRAHYIDAATRSLVITLPLRSNYEGVALRMSFIVEFPPTTVVLPSFSVENRVLDPTAIENAALFLNIGLFFTLFFVVLEMVEILGEGPAAYFSNVWNLLDWFNFLIFALVWWTMKNFFERDSREVCSHICETVGYTDDWELMGIMKTAKNYLSLCVCIQLLKIIKFASMLVPKMNLAPLVLKKALPDIVFFLLVFVISMMSFSTMFYVQLGPVMVDFNTQTTSFLSLGRALFGDFNLDDIIDNSTGYLNAIFFLGYLFVAMFILLSMFFAILGESQANLRDEQRDQRKEGIPMEPEYGVFSHALALWRAMLLKVPVAARYVAAQKEEQEEKLKTANDTGPSAVDRIEARQLELTDKIAEITTALSSIQGTTQQLADKLGAGSATDSKSGEKTEEALSLALAEIRQHLAVQSGAHSASSPQRRVRKQRVPAKGNRTAAHTEDGPGHMLAEDGHKLVIMRDSPASTDGGCGCSTATPPAEESRRRTLEA